MIFPFKKIPLPGTTKTVLRPVVPIDIAGPKGTWTIEGLIDSGADRSLFDIEIAKVLGIDLSKVKKEHFSGIGKDTVTVYTTNVVIEVNGINHPVTIPVGFMEGANVRALLGQDGFFDSFKIIFDRSKDSIEVIPIRKRLKV